MVLVDGGRGKIRIMGRKTTPSFVLELPLQVNTAQAAHLHAHFEAARSLYNAILSLAMRRLRRMQADPAYQKARRLPRTQKEERNQAFSALRSQYGFSEYSLHDAVKGLRCSWIAEHVDSAMAQKLATRAYQSANRVCLGQAKRVRFRSKGRGIGSVEGKCNSSGLRFHLQEPVEGNKGWVEWQGDMIPAIINWKDPVVVHGLKQHVKYVRLVCRKASSPQAKGADRFGDRYHVQLILKGVPYQKPKHTVGSATVGLDLDPTTIAAVSRQGVAALQAFGAELKSNVRRKRRLQRRLDRQRRANNPDNYDEKGRSKKGRRYWHDSCGYRRTRQQIATQERKLAAHRKSLHGRLAHQIVAMGNTVIIEKVSYRSWQKKYGKSVGFCAPGMFVAMLKRLVERTGGTLHEVSTNKTRLSQYCHNCQQYYKKPLSQRWHHCVCGFGPVQRDLYSALLAAFLDLKKLTPSIAHHVWEGVEPGLRAAMEDVRKRAKAGQSLPLSFGIPRARARLPKSLVSMQQESIVLYSRGHWKTLPKKQEPLYLAVEEISESGSSAD